MCIPTWILVIRASPIWMACSIWSNAARTLFVFFVHNIHFTSAEQRKLCFHFCWSVCLLAILRTNAWTDFHKIFRIRPAWNREHYKTFCGRLIHAWLDCFTFLNFGVAQVCALWVLLVSKHFTAFGCSWCSIWALSWRCHEIEYPVMHIDESKGHICRALVWVMSISDPFNVSNDVIPGHTRICVCDVLPVFPCIYGSFGKGLWAWKRK